MNDHDNLTCFVIMPYGKKPDVDGTKRDFEVVYNKLIHLALDKWRGINVVRCDDIEQSGWIHERMIRHILCDRLAVVDTSTLNANVFYELGVRHALKNKSTVLIHRDGTSFPFNIQGMASLKYATSNRALDESRKKLQQWVRNSLESEDSDSLVHIAIPDITVTHGPARKPKRIREFKTYEYNFSEDSDKQIGFVTGDYEDIKIADAWVNSENTAMQMDRYYGKSTSAVIRYLGRTKDDGRIQDTIQQALLHEMKGRERVDPLDVLVTEPGSLATNNVKCILHVASVQGEPGEGFSPIKRVDRCVAAALKAADQFESPLRSIMMPIFGTGPAKGTLNEHARYHLESAIQYLRLNLLESTIQVVYFYAFTDVILETLQDLTGQLGLKKN